MNKFKFYFVVISITLLLFSCNKNDDSPDPVPVRAFGVQYETDKITIENYLETHYIEKIINNPGFVDDQDVTLTKIPTGGTQLSIWSYIPTPDSDPNVFPQLLSKNVSLHDITYKVYYLKLRADNDVDGKSPTAVDEVLVSYSGSYLKDNSTETVVDVSTTPFETLVYPQQRFGLDGVIRGWSEIFPKFKTGTYNADPSPDPATFLNFGAGVMFIPSGLAYFNVAKSSIPAYSPLVFSFKLYDLKRSDLDGNDRAGDGVLSIDEDLNHDGDFTNDDTDGDGIQNYRDIDDDGDGYLTKNEIHKNADGTIIFEDTNANGIPNYLDKNDQP